MQLGGKVEPLANYIMKARSNREGVDVLVSITSREASILSRVNRAFRQ